MRIGLISDTHSHLDDKLFSFLEECDEVWHAGDIGTLDLAQEIADFRPLKAVWGNIDTQDIRFEYPEKHIFDCEGMKIFMIHIGGYPGRYARGVREQLKTEKPDVFICGHSHRVKAVHDEKLNLLHFNPGACGLEGIHYEKTIMRFTIEKGEMSQFQICRLGER